MHTSKIPNHPIIPLLQSLYNQKLLTQHLKTLHAHTITSALIKDPFATNRIIEFFFKKSNTPHYAQLIFSSIHNPDVYSWNSMIIGSATNPHSPHTQQQPPPLPFSPVWYYFQMIERGVAPNNQTFAFIIKACCLMLKMIEGEHCVIVGIGRKMHGQILKHGVEELLVVTNSLMNMYCNMGLLSEGRRLFDESPSLDFISWNIMITGYGRKGQIGEARELFDEMPERSLASWSAIIDGYVTIGEFGEALRLFKEMQDSQSGLRPDAVILGSVLKACANLGALELGRWIHLYILKNFVSWDRDVILGTALVDMYAKCGCIDVALGLFSRMHDKDVVLWNAVIGGLAVHGNGCGALQLFSEMKEQGTTPGATTFLIVLCACVHSGMISEGIKIFESMKKEYGMEPGMEHYGCLADIYGRAGLVHEAEQVLLNMPMEAEASQWGALMAACTTTKKFELGERIGKRLISLEPHDGGRYVLLSNIYAAAGRWDDVRKTRREMDQKGAKKETACSFIERDGVVHKFIAGDTAHPHNREIYEMLDELEREMVGSAQDISQLNDLENYQLL